MPKARCLSLAGIKYFIFVTSAILLVEHAKLLLLTLHALETQSNVRPALPIAGSSPNNEIFQDPTAANGSWTFISLPNSDEERNFYKLGKKVINQFNYDFVIDGANICNKNTSMVILVHSILPHLHLRDGIRSTWGSVSRGAAWPGQSLINGSVKLAFMFGEQKDWTEKLLKENKIHGDIIQGNFTDTYQNLTLKSLLDLKWVVDFCPMVRYVLKSDDDMFINIPYLLNILSKREPLRRTIIGPINYSSAVRRKGKWGISKEEYKFTHFPPYASGSTYVFTADIIGELFEAAKYVPQIFIDDVFITGILARTLGLRLARQYGFAHYASKRPSACDVVLNRIITVHKFYGPNLKSLWKALSNVNKKNCLVGIRETYSNMVSLTSEVHYNLHCSTW